MRKDDLPLALSAASVIVAMVSASASSLTGAAVAASLLVLAFACEAAGGAS